MNKDSYLGRTALFSIFSMPGFGQFYNDEAGKGFLFLGGYVLSVILTFVFFALTPYLVVAIGFIVVAFALQCWSFMDAYHVAYDSDNPEATITGFMKRLDQQVEDKMAGKDNSEPKDDGD